MNVIFRQVGSSPKCLRGYGTVVASASTACQTPLSIGQPTSESHPHLVNPGELCTGVTKAELQSRRSRLVHSVQAFKKNLDLSLTRHTIVIPSACKKYMSDKIPYPFRQNSDFYYLSGCLEPDSVLVLHIGDSDDTAKSVLFMRPKDKHSELWDGVRTGPGAAPIFFGCEEAYSVDELGNYLTNYLSRQPNSTLWYDRAHTDLPKVAQAVATNLQFAVNNKSPESPTPFVHKLRVIKSPAEMNLMRRTCAIASDAVNWTVQCSAGGDSEQVMYANVDYRCRIKNARLAYPPVVAGGANATTIHYIDNNQVVADGEMVLMDAGCEYGGYSSDITRTWPVNGQFTDAQRVLYEVVLALQTDLIRMLNDQSVGARTLDDLFDTMCSKLGGYLQEIGLVDKSISGMELSRAAYNFCPHHVSHYLGMDVHDTPTISRSNPLAPGMVFTVEPGVYIAHNKRNVPAEFRGLGIRIEDDCAVRPDNTIEVLTKDCIKDTDALVQLKNHGKMNGL